MSTSESPAVSCGVGKYFKTKNEKLESISGGLPSASVPKKRKTGDLTGELKDFSAW